MSIEIVLLPRAVGAAGSWAARGADVAHVFNVTTRMKHRGLLVAALADAGAEVNQDDKLTARWDQMVAQLTCDGQGVWSAHVPSGTDLDLFADLIAQVDAAYGRRVQAELVTRLRERAPAAGMVIESERVEPDAVTLVLAADPARERPAITGGRS